MNLRKILHIALATSILAIPVTWLTATNSGLRTGLSLARYVAPVNFNYRKVDGAIIGAPIVLQDVTIKYDGKELQISKLNVDWQQRSFVAHQVQGFTQFLPHAELLAEQQLVIDKVQGQLKSTKNQKFLNINFATNSQLAKINGDIQISEPQDTANWDLEHAVIQVGNNTVSIKKNEQSYAWKINIEKPQEIFRHSSGALHAFGVVSNLHSTPQIHAQAVSKTFIVENYQIKNLHAVVNIAEDPNAPLAIDIAADKIILDQHALQRIAVNASGNLLAHTINASTSYNGIPTSLLVKATVKNTTWHSDHVLLKHNGEQLNGTATYNFAQRGGLLDLHGSLFAMQTQAIIDIKNPSQYQMSLNMRANPQNYLTATLNLKNSKLNGEVDINVQDLAFLMNQIPYITRLQGNLIAAAKISGTVANPIITSEAHCKDIAFTIPTLGVKVTPMELHVVGDRNGKFTLNGKGEMSRGSGDFVIHGYVEPFNPNMPNSINIVGSKVEFVNNQTAHLIASHDLNLHYETARQRLDLSGDIIIHEGDITFADQSKQTVKSKDVVFINEVSERVKRPFYFNPNVNLRIEDGVHFTGFDLNADVSGKLAINNRHGAMYGDGRITIKEGTFKLPGQKLAINKGRLLFPPGTLLVNPMLDIKMRDVAAPDVEIIVQGTAQKPAISEHGLSNNQNRALSQAILTSSNVIAGSFLQDKLKISEIGVTSRDDQHVEFFDDPKDKDSLKNKDLVLGRPVGKRLYLQYLHSMGDDNKRVRLKYALSPVWSIGVESGNQGGGVDLSFVIEK